MTTTSPPVSSTPTASPTSTIKINLTDGRYLTRLDEADFLIPGLEGKECGDVCPDRPHYRCTRTVRHKGDHAAHGYRYELKRKALVMYARWLRS